MKRIISGLLSAVLLSAPVISANAAGNVKWYFGFYDTGEKTVIEDNTVKLFASGIDNSTNTYGMRFFAKSNGNTAEAVFKNADTTPKTITLTAGETYKRAMSNGIANSGDGRYKYNFDNTGATYRKVRAHLAVFDSYFNEDGTCTKEAGSSSGIYHDYKFKYEDMGNRNYYNSSLVVISGGAYTAVTPDQNGFVEFYVCTDVGATTEYITEFSYRRNGVTGGGGGRTGNAIQKLTFGDVDGNEAVDVDDVTVLQMFIAGLRDVNSLAYFHADSNSDGDVNVEDVTYLQFGLAT